MRQAFADVGYRSDDVDAGVSFTYAGTSLNGNAPAPVELLDVDRTAVFTFPDTTENRLAFVQGRANVAVTDVWSVQAIGYYRDLDRAHPERRRGGVQPLRRRPPAARRPANTLCAGGGDDDDDEAQEGASTLVDRGTDQFITDEAGGDAAFNRTRTLARGYGGTLQATARAQAGERESTFVIAVFADAANVDFTSSSEVGRLTPERGVAGSGLFAGIRGLGGDDLFNTDLASGSRNLGLFFHETFSFTTAYT